MLSFFLSFFEFVETRSLYVTWVGLKFSNFLPNLVKVEIDTTMSDVGIKPMSSHMLSMYSTSELHPSFFLYSYIADQKGLCLLSIEETLVKVHAICAQHRCEEQSAL